MKYTKPFSKWDKDKIIQIIHNAGFICSEENAGIFSFYIYENTFRNSYKIYLTPSGLFICNPNVRISKLIKSYKQLTIRLQTLFKRENEEETNMDKKEFI